MFKKFLLLGCVVLLVVCFFGCKKSSEAEKAPVEETMTEESDTTAEEVPAEEAVEEAEPTE